VTPTIRIRLVNAHLPLDAGARRPVLTDLVAAATESTDTTFLCGDLNVAATDGTLESLAAAGFVDLGPDLGPTAPSEAPVVRLDYILCRAGPRTRMVSTVASVHLGLATGRRWLLRLRPPRDRRVDRN
jgi:endonuclease/exonuclease/phosphatase family metal-dependent hydrolase